MSRQVFHDTETDESVAASPVILTPRTGIYSDLFPSRETVANTQALYGVDIDARLIFPERTGGDLWGLRHIDADRLAVFTADFCGHGVAVAPQCLHLSQLMRTSRLEAHDPAAVLSWVNRQMRTLLPEGQFLAMTYALIDVEAGKVSLSASASPPAAVRSAAGLPWQIADVCGLPLGFMEAEAFEAITLPFGAGSALTLYTDALIETPQPPHNRLDVAGVIARANSLPADAPATTINDHLLAALELGHAALAHTPLTDDLTLLTVRRV